MTSNPGLKFVYILADKINGRVSADFFGACDYIEAEELNIQNIEDLVNTYNIIEFNTALKPFAITYLKKKYNASKIIYFDPDIIVFGKLNELISNLDNYDFIVTPHILTPIVNDEYYQHQQGALNTGIFNLGFIAVNYNESSRAIIDWWCFHMRDHGHSNSLLGEFYDQKIMNLLPVFSEKLLIEKNPGYNVAGWNIHERVITKSNNEFLVNGMPLIFYHYSGAILENRSTLVSTYNNLKVTPTLSELLDLYKKKLYDNDYFKMKTIACHYDLKPNIHKASRIQILKYKLKKFLHV
jgi:lipopolysaccharide biosynthesis glycosyltransferase